MLMRRLREQDGFTLPELLTTITIAMIISLATFALIEFTMKRAGEVDQRVDATQRGRALMDTVTRQLRSQVCLDANTPAMATRSGDLTDGSTATFYSDFSDGTTTATKPAADLHKLAYDAPNRRILDYVYDTSWDKTKTPWAPLVSATPRAGTPKVIATDVVPNGTTPLFRYYAYDAAATPAPNVLLNPVATAPMALIDLARVARIDITFRMLPTRSISASAPGSVVLQDQVYVRAADPNDDAPTPTCA
jgi:prepilin-type N-terminal cleavage/methylation domain-containing protein